MDLLAWWNVVFVVPIGLSVLYLILSATGMGGDTGHDHDLETQMDHDVDLAHDVDMDQDVDLAHDVDMDHDVDIDHDVDMDHDVDVDHDVDMDHDVDVDHDVETLHGVDAHHTVAAGDAHDSLAHDFHHEADTPLWLRALSVIGFGKVPVSIIMTCLSVIFGVVGLAANSLFEHGLSGKLPPTVYFWPSFALAAVVSLSFTGSFARLMARYMPTSETYAETPQDLVGRLGTVVFALREGEKGVVDVKDHGGTWHRIAAQPVSGDIPKESAVIVVRYHRDGDYYDVTVSPL